MIIDSYPLSQAKFGSGPVTVDKLQPPTYGRVRTNHVNVFRNEALPSTLDWETSNFSYFFPESLQVVSSAFLRVNLPEIAASGEYRHCPGLYVIDSMRVMSGGNTVYEVPSYRTVLRDYLDSLTDEEYNTFTRAHLGWEPSRSDKARTVHLPILLPNSAYSLRHGGVRGLGVFPADLSGDGSTRRLEVQFTLNPASHCAQDPVKAPGSIANQTAIAIREVKMGQASLERYKNARGSYSIISRRFVPLGPQYSGVANVTKTVVFNQPVGSVVELQIIANSTNADTTRYSPLDAVLPINLALICDSIRVKDFPSIDHIRMHNYHNGFVENSSAKPIARICFSAHAQENSHLYAGAFNFHNVSNIRLEVTFDENVVFSVFAVTLQQVEIDTAGIITATLS